MIKSADMTVFELEKLCESSLMNDNSTFEARLIVMDALNISKNELILCRKNAVDNANVQACLDYVKRRNNGEPLYYILGKTEFYGYPFYVGKGVLIPRQDTETLVDEALSLIKQHFAKLKPLKIVDLCAGSGCVGISLARQLCLSNLLCNLQCIEKYDAAFKFLQQNIKLNGCKNVTAKLADALEFNEECDIVVSNPPYVREDERSILSKEVLNEPETALFAEEDGLLFYRRITQNYQGKCKAILFEIGETQGEQVSAILQKNGFCNIKITKDATGQDRVVSGFSV